MKNLIAAAFVFAILITGCSKENKTETTDNTTSKISTTENKSTDPTTEVIEINLPTMQCGTCKKNIEKALKQTDGVKEANVTVKEKMAIVNYDKSKIDQDRIESVISAAGYQANDKPADPVAYEKLDDCCKLGGH